MKLSAFFINCKDFRQKHQETTQSEISRVIDASLGMVNKYIDQLDEQGYLVRDYKSLKTVSYRITPEGIKRKKYLQMRYIQELMEHNVKSNNIAYNFLKYINDEEFKNVYFYGAGEVAEILLNILNANKFAMCIVGIIDDNEEKQGTLIQGVPVLSPIILNTDQHCGVVITSYTYEEEILDRLQKMNYPQDKIIKYFNMGGDKNVQ